MKEGRPKRLPAVWFYLYDILEKVKQERQEKVKQERQEMDQRLPGAGVSARFFFFSFNRSHMVNFLFCYGSLLLVGMQWVFLGNGQFLLKRFWKIWRYRLILVLHSMCWVLCVRWVKVLLTHLCSKPLCDNLSLPIEGQWGCQLKLIFLTVFIFKTIVWG